MLIYFSSSFPIEHYIWAISINMKKKPEMCSLSSTSSSHLKSYVVMAK